jgi:hypothetical protein
MYSRELYVAFLWVTFMMDQNWSIRMMDQHRMMKSTELWGRRSEF